MKRREDPVVPVGRELRTLPGETNTEADLVVSTERELPMALEPTKLAAERRFQTTSEKTETAATDLEEDENATEEMSDGVTMKETQSSP